MKLKYSSLLMGLLLPITYSHAELSLTPPNAKAGECYAKVVIPAKYKTVEERVLVQEASNKISIIPAKYAWVEEKVEVTPAGKKIVPIPATYKKITKTLEVKSATRSWHNTLKRSSAPVSKEILVAAKLKGVDLDRATPGSCFKEYFTPKKYKIVEDAIIVQSATSKNVVIPAKYEVIEKSIVVKPASKKVLTIPATYAYTEEKILIEKEKTVWKKGINPAQKLDGATGEIMCLVKVPAKYRTIKKKIVKTPARIKVIEIPAEVKTMKIKKLLTPAQTKVVEIPAVRRTIKKKVLDRKPTFSWIKLGNSIDKGFHYTSHQICLIETPAEAIKITQTVLETPASTRILPIPAKYKTVKVKKLVEESRDIKTPIPAVYKMLSKKAKVSTAHQSWERILCQTNMNKHVILQIQKALSKKSYNPGKADGVLGRATRVALDRYQRENSLATGGITYETLNALGIGL